MSLAGSRVPIYIPSSDAIILNTASRASQRDTSPSRPPSPLPAGASEFMMPKNPEKLTILEESDSTGSANVIFIDLDNHFSDLSDTLSCCSTTASEYPRLLTPTKHKKNSYTREKQTSTLDILDYVEPERKIEPVRQIEPARQIEPIQQLEPVRQIEPVRQFEPVRQVEPVRQIEPVKQLEPVRQVEPVRQIEPEKKVEFEENIPLKQSDTEEPKQVETEFELFGRIIGCHLKKLPEDKALKSMARIQSYIVKQRLISASDEDGNFECMHCAEMKSYSKPCRNKGGKNFAKCSEPQGCFCEQSDTSSSLFSDGSDFSPIVSCSALDDD